MRLLMLATLTAIAVVVAAPSAVGADRSPVTINGLIPDDWGQSLSNADKTARDRWPGYARAWCRGIIIAGFRNESSFIYGITRYWDKTFCVAAEERNSAYGVSFVLDAKGRSRGVKMYRVKRGYYIPPSQRGGS